MGAACPPPSPAHAYVLWASISLSSSIGWLAAIAFISLLAVPSGREPTEGARHPRGDLNSIGEKQTSAPPGYLYPTSEITMTKSSLSDDYVPGDTDAEHERLMRQAARLAPYTERLFRDAGIGPGQRKLDIGSGVGDVAMLVARLVGPSGEVVGVDRDSIALGKAWMRAAASGLTNLKFIEADVLQVPSDVPFDAVVGRLILQFLPNPSAVLQTLSRLVRPGGINAFHGG